MKKKVNKGGPKASPGLACPRCDGRVRKLPGNGVSPLPTYQCLRCKTKLTTGSGRVLHGVVGVIGLGLLALGVAGLMSRDPDARPRGIGAMVVAAVVVGYCAYAMFQPAVVPADEDDEADD